MDICVDSNDKRFLNCVNRMLGELDVNLKTSDDTLNELILSYSRLTCAGQERCLNIISELCSDNYPEAIYLMAILLKELQDKKIVYCIEKILLCGRFPLWERLNDMCVFRYFLFSKQVFRDEDEEYLVFKRMYYSFLRELCGQIKSDWSYIPIADRKRTVIIVVSQLVNKYHAPTKYMGFIYAYLKKMGYHVRCYVCHIEGTGGYWDWNERLSYRNFLKRTGSFLYKLNDVKIKGYNLELHNEDYVEGLRHTVHMIWEEKPEFVLELGSETMLAGLCSSFTSVVTMGLTSKFPVTNAQVIASLIEMTEEQQLLWRENLKAGQIIVPIKLNLYEDEAGILYSDPIRAEFGVPKQAFVIIIAGNRLDQEVGQEFESILYRILEKDEHFVIAVIGECVELKKRLRTRYDGERIYFLGHQNDFRKSIAMGDLFINPPRQGGGTGGLFAVMQQVPVITLDHCDVEANVGKDFVCQSVEEMPELAYRYFTDGEFMEKQKENCKKAAAKMNVDNEQMLCRLCNEVKFAAEMWERNRNDTL